MPRQDHVSWLTQPRGPRNVPDSDGQRGVVGSFPDDRRDAHPGDLDTTEDDRAGSRSGPRGRGPHGRRPRDVHFEHPLRLLEGPLVTCPLYPGIRGADEDLAEESQPDHEKDGLSMAHPP